MTLANGSGGSTDWLGLAPTGSPDTTYLQWTYVGAGVTSRTWTINMPGDRRHLRVPAVRRRLHSRRDQSDRECHGGTTAAAGAAHTERDERRRSATPVTVSLTDGPGGPTDWIALAASGAANNNYLQWV